MLFIDLLASFHSVTRARDIYRANIISSHIENIQLYENITSISPYSNGDNFIKLFITDLILNMGRLRYENVNFMSLRFLYINLTVKFTQTVRVGGSAALAITKIFGFAVEQLRGGGKVRISRGFCLT